MVIVVDGQEVLLRDPSDFTRFHVESRRDAAALGEVLEATGWGTVAPDGHAMIAVEAVRTAAAAAGVEAEWSAGFDGMLAYAAQKGWLTDDGAAIQAHVERG